MNNIEKSLDHFFRELQHSKDTWGNFNLPTDPEEKANAILIMAAPDMLRELCRAYLTMLVKFGYGVNSTVTEIRTSIWMQSMLASLCGQISEATRLEANHIQDTFEQYATWINMHEDIPDDTHHTQSS
jgi:hypothetical protein